MRLTLPKAVLTLLFAALLPISALAQGVEDPARILVADFSGQPEDAGAAAALSDVFRADLGDYEMAQLLSPDELKMTLTVEDPMFLLEPTSYTTRWLPAGPDYRLQPYDCDPEASRTSVRFYPSKYD